MINLPPFVLEAQWEAAAQQPIVKAEQCACGAPACWEVAFADAPHYEYFCADHLDPDYIADPVVWPSCDFCHRPAHLHACPELIAFTEGVKAGIKARVSSLHECPSCGDLTAGDCCAACQEYECVSLVHEGMALAV